ncbi:Trafficking protein particle complex subunit 11 [Bulinus truncatus]|nr:Trafficking protein particle complex subunit 11 [Bulinus truncatus]
MSWASELAPELVSRPLGLVALTGLDTTYNAVHKAIWDSFCNNRRADRVPLQFKVCKADHEYPKCKQKRMSYEWYIPKGILKTHWMHKHLQEIPAVVVIFFDLDWDEPLWKEKQMECATRLEIVRNSLQGRNTKIAVVLNQQNAPLPPGEDLMAAERAVSLCSACDISAKSLYVLPHSDHLIGYIMRLENAFYEQAQAYYHQEARKVKSHKDFLNKTTHQLLFVRHQFKSAFFNELKQDSHTAIKHYKQAYGYIIDLRIHDTNMLEIKTVAGFINYKICRLSFQHNAPLDAIAQFRKHIDFFKSKTGIPELSFEHSAWMSKQFQVFGDLFDEAIKLGLTAIQTQHPGFYYQQAANHAIFRKQLCQGLCMPPQDMKSADVIAEYLGPVDFYGQRKWRQGHQSMEPPDLQKEREGILALQTKERQVDHSWLIIPLLSSAVAQFRKYKSPRMKRFLMVQMGEEYYHAKDYVKALLLLNKVMWDYRNERWWKLLTSILEISLKCGYLIAKVQEYVANCMELIGRYSQCSHDEKVRIQMNLLRIFSHEAPEPEPGLDQSCIEKASSLWKDFCSQPCLFTLEMHGLLPFIETKACFITETVSADEKVVIEVCLRVGCPFPVRFSKLMILFTNQKYNSHCVLTDRHGISAASASEIGSGDLFFKPNEPRVFAFSFFPMSEDVGRQIEISSLALEMGSDSGCCAVLKWTGGGGDNPVQPVGPTRPVIKSSLLDNPVDWDSFIVNPTARINPRKALLSAKVEHEPPCLLNEIYSMKLIIDNQEDAQIHKVRVSLGLQESEENHDSGTLISADFSEFSKETLGDECLVDLGSLKKGQKVTQQFYVKCLQSGNRTITAVVSYTVGVAVGHHMITCDCQAEEQFILTSIRPFDVSIKLESMKFETIEAVHSEDPFLLTTDIRCTSPWPIEMKNSSITLSEFIHTACDEYESQISGVQLNKSDCGAECICLVASSCIQPSVSLGTYTLEWKRQTPSSNDLPYVSTTFPLPTVNIEHIPITVHVALPAFGRVKTLLPLCYCVKNRTSYVQEIQITMDSTDNFMFSGNKQTHFRVLPSQEYKLYYNFFPLVAGQVTLPRLHLEMIRYPGTMDDIINKMLPTHIFIRPIGKRPPV